MARSLRVEIVGDASSLQRAFRTAGQSSSRFGGLAHKALLGASGGIVAAFGFAVNAAAGFEKSLNVFQATAGATGAQMKNVSALARKLGEDTKLPGTSAKDAAVAMTELAKGGLSVRDSMSAARATLQLSAAAQISNADAATVVADSLNAFGLSGRQAARVADLLAASANASTASIPEMADALKQVSAVAKTAKVPIQDTVTALTILANAGIKGSDAGTSLKTMLLALIAPTKTSAKAMKELGVSAFDQQGKVKPLNDILAALREKTKGMSDAQRDLALKTIFGTDAFRAIAILLEQTPAQYDKARNAVTKQSAAQKLAEAQTKGFAGALEGLKSSIETLAIEWGTKLLPVATRSLSWMSENTDVLIKLGQAAVVGAAAWGSYKVGLVGVTVASKVAMIATEGLGAALKLSPVGLVLAAVTALAGAYLILRGRSADVDAGFKKVASSARAAAAAIRDQAAATDRLKSASLDVRQAQLRVREAVLREKDTKGTKDHAQAVIDLRRAEIDLREAMRSRGTASEAALTSSRKATAEARSSTTAAKESLRTAEVVVATQGKNEGTLARLTRAQRENIQALARGAQKHREVAAEALRQAAATDTATQRGRDLKRALEGVARVNIDAAIAASLRGIGSAASFAAGQAQGLLDRLRKVASAPRPSGGGGGGGGKKSGGGKKKSDERVSHEMARSFAQAATAGIRAAADAQLAEVNRIQSRIDAIQATRAAKDRVVAAREAVAALAEARKKHEGVAAAERALVQAKEAIAIAGGEKWLAITQRNLERMNTLLAAARDRIGNSFSGLADRVTRAFDAITGAHKTAAEGELDAISARRQAEDQAQAVADAEKSLADLRASPEATGEQIAAAERSLARAREDIRITSLQNTAAIERAAWEQERTALRERLDARLAALQNHFTTEGATVKGATGQIAAALAEFGVEFGNVGALLGNEFVEALKDAIHGVSISAGNLLDIKVSVKKAPKGKRKIKGVGRIPGLAHGGIVTRPTLAMIGEAGPEAVVPLSHGGGAGGGAGGNTFNFAFPNYLGDKREVVEFIRAELIRGGRRMPGILGGLA